MCDHKMFLTMNDTHSIIYLDDLTNNILNCSMRYFIFMTAPKLHKVDFEMLILQWLEISEYITIYQNIRNNSNTYP